MNEINLKGRTAIVTGAAQGFGLAITKRYLKSGAKVIMWDIDEEYLHKSHGEINNSKNCFINIVDVTDSNQVKNAIQESIEDFKNIDIFVNNAGITGPNIETWDYEIDDWKKVIDLDLNGVFYCCKYIVPHMIKNNYGRLVNISSIAGKEGNPNAVA
jgi:3-oxoacyl-[acyl-carrier protein] reductase